VPTLFGLLPHGYSVFDNLLHLVLGAASTVVVFYSQAGRKSCGSMRYWQPLLRT
jgi:hypothetical protein